MMQLVFYIGLTSLAVSCVIFPNSMKVLSAVSLAACFLLALGRRKSLGKPALLYVFWALGSLVTVLYVLIGYLNGAPLAAVYQVPLIYLLFPLLWIVVMADVVDRISLRNVVRGLIIVGFIGCLSVYYFYYEFLTYGASAVRFFIENPNVDVRDTGYVGAAMYVFGSLIFVIGGYISSFQFLGAGAARYAVLALFAATALVSGRSALILSLGIGLVLNLISSVVETKRVSLRRTAYMALWSACIVAAIITSLSHFGVDLLQVLTPLMSKVSSMGGEGRKQEFAALLDGINNNFFLGSGHGIAAAYTVDDRYPWRYEMVWAATVFRVGLLGSLIYATPFVLVVWLGLRGLLKRSLSTDERFIFGGFMCAFVSSNTNPYIEALVFQWMYVLPAVWFFQKYFAGGGSFAREKSDLGAKGYL